MVRASGETAFRNSTLELKLLPLGSRDISADVFTITATATAVGATEISLSTTTGTVDIKAGTSLAFLNATGRAQVLLIEDATVTSTPTAFACSGLIKAVDSAATATFVSGLLPLFGIQDLSASDQPTSVDTTNLQSGIGMESAQVRADHTFEVSGIQIINDQCLNTIVKPLAKSEAIFGREVYAVVTYPDGERIAGAAKMTAYSESGNQNEVRRYQASLQIQGADYSYLPAYIYA